MTHSAVSERRAALQKTFVVEVSYEPPSYTGLCTYFTGYVNPSFQKMRSAKSKWEKLIRREPGKRTFAIVRDETPNKAFSQMKRKNQRPACLEELLSFEKAYPELGDIFLISASASLFAIDGDRRADRSPYTYRDAGRPRLCLEGCGDGTFSPIDAFFVELAIQLES